MYTIGKQQCQNKNDWVFINVLAQAAQGGGQAYGVAGYGQQQYATTGNKKL